MLLQRICTSLLFSLYSQSFPVLYIFGSYSPYMTLYIQMHEGIDSSVHIWTRDSDFNEYYWVIYKCWFKSYFTCLLDFWYGCMQISKLNGISSGLASISSRFFTISKFLRMHSIQEWILIFSFIRLVCFWLTTISSVGI